MQWGFLANCSNGPEIDMEKERCKIKENAIAVSPCVGGGEDYRLIFGYTGRM